MNRSSSVRFRLVMVTVIFLATAPALGMLFSSDNSQVPVWFCLLAGAMALALAWIVWSEHFLGQIKTIFNTTKRLAAGDLSARTGLGMIKSELGELSRNIDAMAAALERQSNEREEAERTLLNRTHQQTVLAALGQFAMVSNDVGELLNQAVGFVAQTLDIEYSGVLEMDADGQSLTLRAGVGWQPNTVGSAKFTACTGSLIGFVFTSGEPAVVKNLRQETRFHPPEVLLLDHGVISSVNVVIAGGTWPFGVLSVHTTKERKFTEDEIHFLIAIATIIAMAVNRRHTEAELHKLAAFAQFNPNPVMEFAADGSLDYFNDAAMTTAHLLELEHPRGYLPSELAGIISECLTTGQSRLRFETRFGKHILSWAFFPIARNRVVHCYVSDVTERTNLEAQLRQSQKMESVGQLAAGVAHDFNNMLTIIQGHSGVIMARPGLPPEMLDSTQAIYFAAERAASLTRQLLLFSRKNMSQPRSLDLKEIVGNMTKMLQRLIGEQITLKFDPPAQLPAMRGDIGMMEQVIMNLAVNARDAMTDGGNLTIALATFEIDREYVQFHPQSRPGSFIRLTVTDTGHGMTREIQTRIFEPFFTTKEVGKGTGLGLATVYGIVKQHEGWVEVISEVGKGTAFEIFFPASDDKCEPAATVAAAITTRIRGGTETILVVEDEPVLRDLAHLILKEHGYRVLEAASGVEALAIWQKERDHIDLLLTDMVMPEGMSGRELANQLKAEKRGLKIICVSGYSVEEVDQAGLVFLQKPYTRLSLAKTVRETLDHKTG